MFVSVPSVYIPDDADAVAIAAVRDVIKKLTDGRAKKNYG